jgi:hypothetical protein
MELQQGFGINRMGKETRLQRGNFGQLMSALSHKRTLKRVHLMFALPPEADIAKLNEHVRFVLKVDIGRINRSPRRRARARKPAAPGQAPSRS